ncbi:sigma-54-dependent Fis family transcriptional regulator [Treponema sp. OMZ 840]|uniref:sigma 54-interacting transcriptional regulator n=1 Tax=Treponema sp. OMZ 840 TaxID=244313 RepID=UPI003D9293ED
MIRVLLISGSNKIKNFCLSLQDKNLCVCCTSSFSASDNEALSSFSVILFDFCLFEQGYIQKTHDVFKQCGDLPVLVLASEKTAVFAAKMLKVGASDVIIFPCCSAYLYAYIRYYAAGTDKSFILPETIENPALNGFIGVSKVFTVLKKHILLAARNDMPVLLLGETGTGKSRAARLIHDLSVRKQYPFIEENIAAVQETLVEGELFGTRAGAYTGAVTRAGLFEKASGGTLFLDEIGSISTNIQAKLLRVLETGEFRRVGDAESKKADVRIICATNSPLNSWKDSGLFRKDLYYRITGIEIFIPPLTKRREDILPLAHSFLERLCFKNDKVKYFSPEAEQKLLNHNWPGNIRELQNCVSRAFYVAERAIILDTDIGFVL